MFVKHYFYKNYYHILLIFNLAITQKYRKSDCLKCCLKKDCNLKIRVHKMYYNPLYTILCYI